MFYGNNNDIIAQIKFLQTGKDFVNRLHKAIASAQPGDVIALEPGEYTLKVCTRSGMGEGFGVRSATRKVTVA